MGSHYSFKRYVSKHATERLMDRSDTMTELEGQTRFRLAQTIDVAVDSVPQENWVRVRKDDGSVSAYVPLQETLGLDIWAVVAPNRMLDMQAECVPTLLTPVMARNEMAEGTRLDVKPDLPASISPEDRERLERLRVELQWALEFLDSGVR